MLFLDSQTGDVSPRRQARIELRPGRVRGGIYGDGGGLRRCRRVEGLLRNPEVGGVSYSFMKKIC